ncbi:MAG TPA: alanine racemase [Actinomycetota bacterium]|jgi:D-serine deaminase-like pyridoxal phosphate-dependent protein
MVRLDLHDVLATPITGATVGFPANASVTLGEVRSQGWGRADLTLPSVTLRERALAHNLARMARYCADEDVDLAPHGKTTMAPQLWARQLEAGAWGITAATPAQARAMVRVGVPRVLLANEVVDAPSIAWVAAALEDPGPSLACWVDSLEGVRILSDGLSRAGVPRPLDVMVEVGHRGGRAGARSVEAALEVARAAARAPALRFVGVAGYEGTLGHERTAPVIGAVDRYLATIRAVAERAIDEGLVGPDVWISAGGSIFFDRVVEGLRDGWPDGADVRLVLRAGCTITHDHGVYARGTPLAGDDGFIPAFDVRGAVLSRPEPETIVVGVGKRDVPFDVDPPVALEVGGRPLADGEVVITRLMDQHAICTVRADIEALVGEEVRFGISHPCAAFDRRRVIAVLDDDDLVVSAIATVF